MFFVLDKPRLQRFLAIVRKAGRHRMGRADCPFLRLEAQGDELTLSGTTVSATLPATVYEPGVLFLRTAILSRLLRVIRGEKQLAFQVRGEALYMDDLHMRLDPAEMKLFPDPNRVPPLHEPKEPPQEPAPPKPESSLKPKPPTLFDMDSYT